MRSEKKPRGKGWRLEWVTPPDGKKHLERFGEFEISWRGCGNVL